MAEPDDNVSRNLYVVKWQASGETEIIASSAEEARAKFDKLAFGEYADADYRELEVLGKPEIKVEN